MKTSSNISRIRKNKILLEMFHLFNTYLNLNFFAFKKVVCLPINPKIKLKEYIILTVKKTKKIRTYINISLSQHIIQSQR